MSTFSLSGAGTQALSAGTTGLYVSITTLPAGLTHGRANPTNHFDIALFRFTDGTGFSPAIVITGGPDWIGVPVGSTGIAYAVLNGAVLSVQEIIGGVAPLPPVLANAQTDFMPSAVSVASAQCLGVELAAMGSVYSASFGWLSANISMLSPLRVTEQFVCTSAFMQVGSTAAGHWDIGIYDEAFALLGHTGSVLTGTATLLQTAALSLTLSPGRYWLAIAADSTSFTAGQHNYGNASKGRAIGIRAASSNFPLASTPTMATVPGGLIPEFGVSRYTP